MGIQFFIRSRGAGEGWWENGWEQNTWHSRKKTCYRLQYTGSWSEDLSSRMTMILNIHTALQYMLMAKSSHRQDFNKKSVATHYICALFFLGLSFKIFLRYIVIYGFVEILFEHFYLYNYLLMGCPAGVCSTSYPWRRSTSITVLLPRKWPAIKKMKTDYSPFWS